MSGPALSLNGRVAELKRNFEHGFAQAAQADRKKLNFLAIAVGGRKFALRLSEIAGLHAGKSVTRVPGGGEALLGIAGFRGALLPVYQLAALLGEDTAASPRWLVLAAAAPLAFAFDAFEGQLHVSPEAVLPAPSRRGSQPEPRQDLHRELHQQSRPDAQQAQRSSFRDFLDEDGLVRPIIHLPSVLAAITA